MQIAPEPLFAILHFEIIIHFEQGLFTFYLFYEDINYVEAVSQEILREPC